MSREVWILALVILINRSGLMVTTFLGVYLKEHLDYSLAETGSVLMFYGIGSLAGVFMGGVISEKVGYLRVQFMALALSGVFIFVMQYASELWHFSLLLFLAIFFADMYRPANMGSLTMYSRSDNRTRSLALLRLAINLGISIGPVVGGFLIGIKGYTLLFYVDGITCVVAGFVLLIFLGLNDKEKIKEAKKTPLKWREIDLKSFAWLLFSNLFWAFSFFQIIYMYPIFMKSELGYAEFIVGLTYSLSGLMILFMEMPIVKMYEKFNKRKILFGGTLICAFAYVFLYYSESFSIFNPYVFAMPLLYMIFITMGEIFYLPFAGSLALNMAPKGHSAKFMAVYSMIFSVTHILAPLIGAFLADYFGFKVMWMCMGIAMIIVLLGLSLMNDERLPQEIKH
ncbi:MAG: MFS transporter [Bacteroidota bacterium]